MKKIWILFVAAAFAAGCSDNKGEEGGDTPNQLSLSAETLNFLVDGTSDGENAVTITSDGDWRLVGFESWCTPSAVAGKSGDKVTFTVAENPSNDARSTTYTFIRGNKAVKLAVSQLQNSVFDVEGGSVFTVSPQLQTITLVAHANFEVTPEIDVPWIVSADGESTRGVQTQFLRFVVGENVDYDGRSGKITIRDVEGTIHELMINQQQVDAAFFNKTLFNLDFAGGELVIDLNTNIDYQIEISANSASWIHHNKPQAGTKGLVKHTETFTIDPASSVRGGKIVFKKADGSYSQTLLIRQGGSEYAYVTVPDDNFRAWLEAQGYIFQSDETRYEITQAGQEATSFDCSSKQIKSLEGIEAFTKLTTLNCNNNPLNNVPLGNLMITSLNLSNNNSLFGSIKVSGANLTSLNFNFTFNMTVLDMSECPGVNTLDIGNCWYFETLMLKTGQTIAKISDDLAGYYAPGGKYVIVYK